MHRNDIERFFGGIIGFFLILLTEIISLLGINILPLFEKWPFLLGFGIILLIAIHFIPEEVYDYYEYNPALFYVVYIIEFVFMIILAFALHSKYYS
ncbi:MAG: hypothetical protein K6B17_10285 [Treponema sp.]|nr:hypothetical protein [Treponema sp.]